MRGSRTSAQGPIQSFSRAQLGMWGHAALADQIMTLLHRLVTCCNYIGADVVACSPVCASPGGSNAHALVTMQQHCLTCVQDQYSLLGTKPPLTGDFNMIAPMCACCSAPLFAAYLPFEQCRCTSTKETATALQELLEDPHTKGIIILVSIMCTVSVPVYHECGATSVPAFC
jgi:hypothetical protein